MYISRWWLCTYSIVGGSCVRTVVGDGGVRTVVGGGCVHAVVGDVGGECTYI